MWGIKIKFGKELDEFPESEKYLYWEYLKIYRDYKNAMDTAFEKGKQQGYKQGVGLGMKSVGCSIQDIINVTGLSLEEVKELDAIQKTRK